MKVLEDLGYLQPKEKDIELLRQICQVMSERAARLASAGLAAIVKVNIAKYLSKKHIYYYHIKYLKKWSNLYHSEVGGVSCDKGEKFHCF